MKRFFEVTFDRSLFSLEARAIPKYEQIRVGAESC
jgi:hypothetical protein